LDISQWNQTLYQHQEKPGRPVGSRTKRRLWVEELLRADAKEVRKFVDTIKRKAIVDEDPDFAKMWLDRIAPVRKGALLRFPLPPITPPSPTFSPPTMGCYRL
jgi:hypothetical protein